MGTQLFLPLDPAPRPPRAEEARSAPVVWVRRLYVLRDLRPGDEFVLRRIDLRRGLNILWAAPNAGNEENRLFQGRITGHTAGKTTFCRLIRHVLGEPTFGTQSIRQRLRARFPDAWAIGEIYVGSELWAVARPLGIGRHPFAVRGASIEGIFDDRPREEYASFLEALQTAALRSLPIQRFPSSDQPIGWEHLLPWLSRDQESRFASFVEWRDPTSESDSPKLVADDRYVLVRAVLDLISDEERLEQRHNAELLARKQESMQKLPLLAHQLEVDRRRLATLLGFENDARAEGPLFGDDLRKTLADRRAAVGSAEAEMERQFGGLLTELRAQWERAIAERVEANRALYALETQIERAKKTIEGNPRDLGAAPKAEGEGAFCRVPLAVARAEGCPLAARWSGERRAAKTKRASATEPRDPAALIGELERELEAAREALAHAKAAEQSAHTAWSEAIASRKDEEDRRAKERSAIDQAEWLFAQVEEGRLRLEAEECTHATLEKDLKRSYEKQESFRKRRAIALGEVSARFHYVVRALLGEEASGRLEDDGRYLSLRIEEHGERESAALSTLKLLAFDLAALTASVEGHGSFPRLLIHDGPREADMDQRIYERLFLYGRSLEERFLNEPGFQYIVTTTAPPPASLQKAPWLLQPVLDASRPEGRLLGVDL